MGVVLPSLNGALSLTSALLPHMHTPTPSLMIRALMLSPLVAFFCCVVWYVRACGYIQPCAGDFRIDDCRRRRRSDQYKCVGDTVYHSRVSFRGEVRVEPRNITTCSHCDMGRSDQHTVPAQAGQHHVSSRIATLGSHSRTSERSCAWRDLHRAALLCRRRRRVCARCSTRHTRHATGSNGTDRNSGRLEVHSPHKNRHLCPPEPSSGCRPEQGWSWAVRSPQLTLRGPGRTLVVCRSRACESGTHAKLRHLLLPPVSTDASTATGTTRSISSDPN
jgi:hypothetical protein